MLVDIWGIQGHLLVKERLESTFKNDPFSGECYHFRILTGLWVHAEFTAGTSQHFSSVFFFFLTKLNSSCSDKRQNDAFGFSRRHKVDWFPLRCKTKGSNTMTDPLGAGTVAVPVTLATNTESEEPGGSRRCMVSSMFLTWLWHYADSLWICLQRYSVAVYLVRVFTAADLFSQLKHCSVESAERCRERSKCRLRTPAQCLCHSSPMSSFQLLMSVVSLIRSPRQTTIWSGERNCDNRPPSVPHLSSEYTLVLGLTQLFK